MGTPIDISLNDATPTAQVYNPVGRQTNGAFRFTDKTPVSGTTSADTWNHVTVAVSAPTSSKKHARAKLSMSFVNPDFDPAGLGEETQLTTMRVTVDAIIPDNLTAAARADAYATLASFIASDEAQAAIEDIAGVF